jgi:hypothetical protein
MVHGTHLYIVTTYIRIAPCNYLELFLNTSFTKVKRAGTDELALTLYKLNELALSDEVALNIIGHDSYFASSPVLLLLQFLLLAWWVVTNDATTFTHDRANSGSSCSCRLHFRNIENETYIPNVTYRTHPTKHTENDFHILCTRFPCLPDHLFKRTFNKSATCIHAYTHARQRMHTCIPTYTHTWQRNIHAYTHTCIHTYTIAQLGTHTKTL